MDTYTPLPIEDYAVIGDMRSSALVGRNGSIDWLCWPRFDSNACFAALLGTADHGRWQIAPASSFTVRRSYRDSTLVLETVFTTPDGDAALIDLMPVGEGPSTIVRIVEGRRGTVRMGMDLALRFDYGTSIPWVEQLPGDGGITAIAGPELVVLRTTAPLRGENLRTLSEFTVAAGERVAFVLANGPSHLPPPGAIDADQAVRDTEAHWRDWSGRCTHTGPYRDAVVRSLLTLKSLTYTPTGGMVAAATTSLPEQLGGNRNWDYRFCWLRDATLTLFALMLAGYYDEAASWRNWLHRSLAGAPSQVQIMYGLAGERRLSEWTVPWLPGYQGASPVRIGNAASDQVQLDVYGEVMNALHQARGSNLAIPSASWDLQCAMLDHLEGIWADPDEGIWEVRGGRKNFTFSKVMAWVAFDRAVADAEHYSLPGPVDHWRTLRDQIHRTICTQGFDADRNSFVQSFGSQEVDASLLLLPMVGFLPPDDPRMVGTIEAIEHDLLRNGFVLRYRTESSVDGLPPGEGAFLACSFWLAGCYHLIGRCDDARALFERLVGLCNDVGLLAEEYDPAAGRMVGNFPQAFSHVAMIGCAMQLSGHDFSGRSEKTKAA